MVASLLIYGSGYRVAYAVTDNGKKSPVTIKRGENHYVPKTIHRYKLPSEYKAVVNLKTKLIELYKNGKLQVKNATIIKGQDARRNCPAEGFMAIVSKGQYFTVEQGGCGGWFLINEYTTFKYSKNKQKYFLHKFGLVYLDRRNPGGKPLKKVYTRKDFGEVPFKKVNIESLYKLSY